MKRALPVAIGGACAAAIGVVTGDAGLAKVGLGVILGAILVVAL